MTRAPYLTVERGFVNRLFRAGVLALGAAAALSGCAHAGAGTSIGSMPMSTASMTTGSMGTGSASSPAAAAIGSGAVTVGSITVSGAEVKVPVTPDETVGYLVISDHGPADELLGASSPDAQSVDLHMTTGNASVQTMQTVTDLPVPAHGRLVFALGGDHLMLMQPTGVRLGSTVPLLLRFRTAGVVAVWATVSRYGTDVQPGPTATATR
jgi:copper(I)-binding protein